MKVNTDGVLLSAWVDLPKSELLRSNDVYRILDIGTGTGVIALIIAQRLEEQFVNNEQNRGERAFQITGIDLDEASASEAAYNFEESPWSSYLMSIHTPLKDYIKDFGEEYRESFSLILSNPPFFSSSLKASSHRRSVSRHNDMLPFDEILKAAESLLKRGGILAVVLPVNEGDIFIRIARFFSFSLLRLCRVKPLAHKKAKRVLLEFVKGEAETIQEEELVIQEKGKDCYTPQYNSLVGDFYLSDR